MDVRFCLMAGTISREANVRSKRSPSGQRRALQSANGKLVLSLDNRLTWMAVIYLRRGTVNPLITTYCPSRVNMASERSRVSRFEGWLRNLRKVDDQLPDSSMPPDGQSSHL